MVHSLYASVSVLVLGSNPLVRPLNHEDCTYSKSGFNFFWENFIFALLALGTNGLSLKVRTNNNSESIGMLFFLKLSLPGKQ